MKIFNTKIVKRFLVIIIVGFILGIVLYFLTDEMEKLSISSSLINYINMIKNSSFEYGSGFLNTLVYNLKYLTIIWLSGIIFILMFISPVVLFIQSFLTGFSLINIIAVFKLKGIIYGIIISIPSIINILIYILMSYYSIKFATKTYKTIKNNATINLKLFIKNYVLIYLIFSFLTLINALFETYIISNILKLIS